MVILGLGCNLGDKLKQLRHAFTLLKKIPSFSIQQVSPLYVSDALLPENAPPSWNTPFFNLAVRCETTLDPLDLLAHLKRIEKEVGRQPEKHWGPRIMDIDILAWDDLVRFDEKLHVPHECLHERPFALWPLTDIAPRWVYPLPGPLQGKTATEIAAQWGSRFDGNAPFHTRQISHRIDTPALVGIINITPDSFSGDGLISHEIVLEKITAAVEAGAEIIDMGAEATGPRAAPIDSHIEWQRLENILPIILQERKKMRVIPKISIDTRHADVAEKSLSLGIDWINDVSGLDTQAMRHIIKSQTNDIVFMHHLGIPVSQQSGTLPLDQDPLPLLYTWAEKRILELEKEGIDRNRLIFDVGIGFGKTAEQSLEILQRISFFHSLGVRLLVGHSRKSCFNLFTQKPSTDRDVETLVSSLYLADHDIDFLRVHNVDYHARGFKVKKLLN